MYSESSRLRSWIPFQMLLLLTVLLSPCGVHYASAQGASNQTGNGGIHTIQGRLYVSSGQRSNIFGLRIRLRNVASNELSVIADGTGTFTFRYLVPGSYTVVVEGGEGFQDVTEHVIIDDPGSSNLSSTIRLRGGAKTANVQIFLKPKPSPDVLAALEVINAKLAQAPKNVRDLYESAQKSIREDNDAQAIAQLRSAVALQSDFSLGWNLLGLLLQRAGDYPGSVAAFRSALKYDPESAAIPLNLGTALFNAQQYAEAEPHLMTAILKNRASYRAHYYMGLTQMKLGRLDIAEQAFRTAIEVGGQQAGMAHYMLAGIYWSVKRYKDAADQLERYLELEPNAKDVAKTRQSIAELRKKQS